MRKAPLPFAVGAVLAASACGGTPPLVTPPPPPAPAMVQVENAPGTEPHAGLQQANLVFEYLTEGGITRFTVVYFNPGGSSKIEPVRSARLITLRLLHAFGGVLFFSGASSHVSGLINSEHLPHFDENSKYFHRDFSREAPHNLYTTDDLLAQGVQSKGLHRSYALWPTGSPGGGGRAVTTIAFAQTPSHHVTVTFGSGVYTYKSEEGPEADAGAGGQPLKISNVVLLQVAHHNAGYTEDVLGAQGIDFDLQGTGPATVYSGGKRYDARWDLSNPDRPLRLLASTGTLMRLPAGLTWIFVVDPGAAVQES